MLFNDDIIPFANIHAEFIISQIISSKAKGAIVYVFSRTRSKVHLSYVRDSLVKKTKDFENSGTFKIELGNNELVVTYEPLSLADIVNKHRMKDISILSEDEIDSIVKIAYSSLIKEIEIKPYSTKFDFVWKNLNDYNVGTIENIIQNIKSSNYILLRDVDVIVLFDEHHKPNILFSLIIGDKQ